ncbi:hypothetical protein [Luteimonas vadosa]|uniref:DUF1232 domain-containing protein n=1 Tax=Luteimonas vadosa TaxID=1165507 RepID=A0ABP9E5I3_9GAMM
MNANLNIATQPLPLLASTPGMPHRRHRVAGIELANGSLRRFREVASSLQTDQCAPDVDAIACAARNLTCQFSGMRRAPAISVRMRALRALRAMASEPAWDMAPAQQRQIALISDYAANEDRLVPDATPVIGGLDEAVLVDLAWPSVRFELDDYLDFRRLRAEEAAMRGRNPHDIRFDRQDWIQAKAAERAWRAHVSGRGCSSYLDRAAAPVFQIH